MELNEIEKSLPFRLRALISIVCHESHTLHKDSGIGQLIIMPVVIADFVTEFSDNRGTGVFGSNGE